MLQLEAAYLHQQQQQAAVKEAYVQQQRLEGHAIEKLKQHLIAWQNKCPICAVLQVDAHHRFSSCTDADAAAAQQQLQLMQTNMTDKKLFVKYSDCFWCYVPQEICERWEVSEGPKGGYRLKSGMTCQFSGVMMETWIGMITAYDILKDAYADELKKRVNHQGSDRSFNESLWKYMGQKLIWGGLECNNLAKEFYTVCEIIEQ